MDRRRTLRGTLTVLLAFSGLLLAHPLVFGDSLEETYAPWKERVRVARAELDDLKVQRQRAQAAYEDLVSQLRMRGNPIDPDKEAQAAATIKEIDQRILAKENEINTTIPDEARQAGVPSSVLSQ